MSAPELLAYARNGTTWKWLSGRGWKCIMPGRDVGPGKGIGRTPLEALQNLLDGR